MLSHILNAINPLSEVLIIMIGAAFTTLGEGIFARIMAIIGGALIISVGVFFIQNFVHEQLLWGQVWISLILFFGLFRKEDASDEPLNLSVSAVISWLIWLSALYYFW
jgi:hypothetical protein